MNIWNSFKKPITILAPMEDVTDTVFRQIVIGCGRPTLFFTEFTNTDGMCSIGGKEVMKRLKYDPVEKPIIAQIWGNKPENFLKAAKMIAEMGFDGIDLNFGCPEKNVLKAQGGGAIIKQPELAKEIYRATFEGAGSLPVSIKTRIGFDKICTEDWIGGLLELEPAAITVHGRTVAELSNVDAHWDEIKKAVELRNGMKKGTLIIGNGDIRSVTQINEYPKRYLVDGVMIGRGIFENPWIFGGNENPSQVSLKKRIDLLLKHSKLFVDTWGESKNYEIMKKFFKIYINGFEGAADIRINLMAMKSHEEVDGYLKTLL